MSEVILSNCYIEEGFRNGDVLEAFFLASILSRFVSIVPGKAVRPAGILCQPLRPQAWSTRASISALTAFMLSIARS